MLRSRSSYAADKDALDRGAYGSKTWDTVSTACPTQRIVDAPNRVEAQGNIRCAACTARLSSPPSSHSSNAFLKCGKRDLFSKNLITNDNNCSRLIVYLFTIEIFDEGTYSYYEEGREKIIALCGYTWSEVIVR